MSLTPEELAANYSQDELLEMLIKSSKGKPKGKPKSALEKFNDVGEDLAHSILEGGTLGFGPKALAKIGALYPKEGMSYDERYKVIRNALRGKEQQAAERSPIASFVGNLAGGIKMPISGKSAIKAGLGGAGYGLASGVGHSDEDNSLLRDVIKSIPEAGIGATGGVLGQQLNKYLFSKKVDAAAPIKKNVELSKKYNVPLSEGQITRDVDQLLREENILEGRKGVLNQKNLAAFERKKEEALQSAIGNVKKDIGKGDLESKGEALRKVIEQIQEKAANEKSVAKSMYKEATENVTQFSSKDLKSLPKQLISDLEALTITEFDSPKAYSKINSLERLLKNKEITFNQFEGWRKGLNRAIKESPIGGQDQFALEKLKDNADSFINSHIEKALEQGDIAALEKFKKARHLWHNWSQTYKAKSSKEVGQKFIQDIVENAKAGEKFTDEQIVNKLFGFAANGLKPESVHAVRAIKKLVSPEEFNALRLEAAHKVLAPLQESLTTKSYKPGKYLTNLDNLLKNNKTLMKELFEDNQIAQLKEIGHLADLAKPGPQNASGTAKKAASLIENFLSNIPIVGTGLTKGYKIGANLTEQLTSPILSPIKSSAKKGADKWLGLLGDITTNPETNPEAIYTKVLKPTRDLVSPIKLPARIVAGIPSALTVNPKAEETITPEDLVNNYSYEELLEMLNE